MCVSSTHHLANGMYVMLQSGRIDVELCLQQVHVGHVSARNYINREVFMLYPLPPTLLSPSHTLSISHTLPLTHSSSQAPVPVPRVPPPYSAVASPLTTQPRSLQHPSPTFPNGPVQFTAGSAPQPSHIATAPSGECTYRRLLVSASGTCSDHVTFRALLVPLKLLTR